MYKMVIARKAFPRQPEEKKIIVMDLKLWEKLNNEEYSIASLALSEILTGKLTYNEVVNILNSNNKLVVGDFLSEYEGFTPKMLEYIEQYIDENIYHANRLFVSDLISFASDWTLNINYKTCLKLLDKKGDDNDYVMISLIDYVFENFKIQFVDEIFEKYSNILYGNNSYNQTCKIKVAFYLFRISHDEKFYFELEGFMKKGDDIDREVLRNLLEAYYNQEKYFSLYNRFLMLL